MVSKHAPAALYPQERPSTHFTLGWLGPRAGLDRCGKSLPHLDSIPDRPARSSVAIPTELPGIYPKCIKFHLTIASRQSDDIYRVSQEEGTKLREGVP